MNLYINIMAGASVFIVSVFFGRILYDTYVSG